MRFLQSAAMTGPQDPFATPMELRNPARRFRGRLAAPVTLWTAGAPGSPSGLTVSSLLVAEGEPSSILGLLNPMTDLWEALHATRAFVVHVLERRHRVLAERFAGTRPSPGGLFHGVDVEDSSWGPRVADLPDRAYCRLQGSLDVGWQHLVRGTIERVELGGLDDPLTYFRGRYRALEPPKNP
jgi:3-hydroxy-9,10-secoandrosta-1,3,5(10)-triene-9,17-dione monooxygenase reductase component